MSKTIYLSLAIHNHQPVGNFDHVFAEAYERAYLPLVEALERHPVVRLALHYSGPLRDWLAANRPDFLPRIRALVLGGQVEMMGGAYYEPILVALPDADKQGQIRKMTQQVWDDFAYRAVGGWLAERVWESHLPKALAEAGLEYTIVDDTHFKYVGMEDKDLFGYYVTEEQGVTFKIFGTSMRLRYLIPWGTVDKVIAYLKSEADESGSRVAVMGDDGEKFGLWPYTYPHCWGKDGKPGWIETFFSAIEENSDWLKLILPGEFASRFPPLGRVYLPAASYDEMTEWALPATVSRELARLKHHLEEEKETAILRFIRGGMWRSFMVKYSEVNAMHKKMLWVSRKVHRMADGEEKRNAADELWRGQCNCPYWHGVFGGIYLFHIRSANYSHLLAAEAIADRAYHGDGEWATWEVTDYDADGQTEILLESGVHNATFAPNLGGCLLEWDWRERRINLANTLTRREEAYHRDLIDAAKAGTLVIAGEKEEQEMLESIHTTRVRARERGLENFIIRDWYQRTLLLDHFLPTDAILADFFRAQYSELGDFVDRPYVGEVEQVEGALLLRLWREGGVWNDEYAQPVRVEKRIRFPQDEMTLDIRYTVTNMSDKPLICRFGVESNWALLGGNGPGATYAVSGQEPVALSQHGEYFGVDQAVIAIEWLRMQINIAMERPAILWHYPIETVSNSEAGFERVYQGASVTTLWDLNLAPGETWQTDLTYAVGDLT